MLRAADLIPALAAAVLHGAEPAGVATLAAAPRHLVALDGSRVLACLAANGLQAVTIDGESATAAPVLAGTLALHALPLPGERVLVGTRSGRLALFSTAQWPELPPIADWPAEGLPTHLALRGGMLYVASGGDGVIAYRWDAASGAPEVAARFPFVDYSKELAFDSEGRLFLADNRDTGLQLLEADDPARLGFVRRWTPGDYVDSVAVAGGFAFAAARRTGVHALDPSWTSLRKGAFLPKTSEESWVSQVAATRDGRVVVCEGEGGARLATFTPVAGWTVLAETGASAQCVVELEGGSLLLGGADAVLRRWRPGPKPR
ncbi:MAG: hypothetical protein SF028_05245 [Candidatus Sumerlaeia bacterium]|nr:hypothetical protein [Candidatus Sumerlaeia bacterium]